MGSAMGYAYNELLRQPFDDGHYYLYIPKNRPAGALPVIVFLHGSVGHFKAYTWAWARLAEEQGYVIVAPSFGFGLWGQPGGTDAALAALEDAKTRVEIDESQVYLAGLSNGGLGVSLLAQQAPERFRGLMFFSPVMKTEVVDRESFQQAWNGRPVLIVTGEADERVSVSYVAERASRMEQGGVSVTYVTYPGEDHFLFFSQLDNVLQDVASWLSGTANPK
jgi:poly(3-hydroxybutyrate) depolymerase